MKKNSSVKKETSESVHRPSLKEGTDNDRIMEEVDAASRQLLQYLFNRQLAELAELAGKYNCTNNPLYVWRAIRICCDEKIELPDWVSTYLLDSAEELTNISGTDGSGAGKATKLIATALKMRSSSGQKNVFARFEDHERYFDEGLEYPELRAVSQNNEEVYTHWAKERGIDVDSMKKSLQRSRRK